MKNLLILEMYQNAKGYNIYLDFWYFKKLSLWGMLSYVHPIDRPRFRRQVELVLS